MFKWITKIFSKKEEILFPNEFALIRFSDVAKLEGIQDDQNKEIVLFKNGKEHKKYPYSDEIINILKKQGIPVEQESFDEEEYEFDSVSSFGGVSLEK